MKIQDRYLDPRTKLFIVLCISSLAVWIQDIRYLTIILLIAIIVGKILKCEFFSVIKKIKKMLGIFLAMIVIQSIFTIEGSALLKLGSITLLTDVGMLKALNFILRISIILVSATIITTSTSREIIQGLVELKIPYEISFMVSVAIRFLPMLMEEIKDTFIAIQLRGINFNDLNYKQKIKIYSYIFTPVVVSTIMKSQKLSIAMESRGFRAYNKRTSYLKLNMMARDYIIIIISLALSIGMGYIYIK